MSEQENSDERSQPMAGDERQPSTSITGMDLDTFFSKISQKLEKAQDETKSHMTDMIGIVKTEIEQVNMRIDKMDEKIEERFTNFKLNIDEKVQTDLQKFETNMQQICEMKLDKTEEKMSGELSKVVNPILQKVADLETEVKILKEKQLGEKIQVIVTPSMFKSDMEQKFGGDVRINPKTFVKNLRDQVANISEVEQLRKAIRSALKGDVELWWDIHEQSVQNFDEFEIIFLSYYWGEQTQAKIREQLFFGKYDENYNVSREKYAMRKYATAKQLDPPIANEDITTYIARHFEDEIRNVIVIHDIRSIDRLLEYLRRIDDNKRPQRKSPAKQTNAIRREVGSTEYNSDSERRTPRYTGTDYETRRYEEQNRRYDNQERRYENNGRKGNYRRNNNEYRNRNERRNEYNQDRIRNPSQNREETRRNTQEYKTQEYRRRPDVNWRKENEISRSNEENSRKESQGQSRIDESESRNRNVNNIVQIQEKAIIHDVPDAMHQDF